MDSILTQVAQQGGFPVTVPVEEQFFQGLESRLIMEEDLMAALADTTSTPGH